MHFFKKRDFLKKSPQSPQSPQSLQKLILNFINNILQKSILNFVNMDFCALFFKKCSPSK
ncbi:MAG: hypothetical protein EBU33_07400 [Sphingobacteriia bacterium]|nr:hypothetical protein [Sphingobacteriia bacterium]